MEEIVDGEDVDDGEDGTGAITITLEEVLVRIGV